MNPFLLLRNHSCDPNVYWSFEGRELRIFTAKQVKVDEELYISYTHDLRDFDGRRSALREGWSFECTCELCQAGGSIHPLKTANDLGFSFVLRLEGPSSFLYAA